MTRYQEYLKGNFMRLYRGNGLYRCICLQWTDHTDEKMIADGHFWVIGSLGIRLKPKK